MLLENLRSLETELHTTETRRNTQRMETLLHPDFVEFGRSGRRYTRAEILNQFGPTSVIPAVRSGNFDLALLAEGIASLDTCPPMKKQTESDPGNWCELLPFENTENDER